MMYFGRILLVSHEMTYTGAPNSLLNIARLLYANDINVSVVTLNEGPFKCEFEKYGFNVSTINVESYDFSELLESFDAVIANTVFAGGFALEAQKYVPTYLYLREAENLNSIIEDCGLQRDYIDKCENIICVSEYAEESIRSNFLVNNLTVLHNFIYEDEYNTPEINASNDGKIHFLIAGTIEKRKGIADVLAAMNLLEKNTADKVIFHIVGRKPQWASEYWNSLQLDNSENIIYHGEINDRDEMDKLYRSVNVVVVASYDEACSMTALEGAMHGRALIVTENTGAKYIVDDNGIIVETGSPKALAKAFAELAEDSQRLVYMGRRSFEMFMQTSNKNVYLNNFNNLINSFDGNNSEAFSDLDNDENNGHNPDFLNDEASVETMEEITKTKELYEKQVYVCFIADENYTTPTCTAISSLCCNSDSSVFYNIYVIMPANSSLQSKEYFSETASRYYNAEVTVIEQDMGDLALLHKGDDSKYLAATSTALLKFKIANIFPQLDKILYLDGDIIVRTDISELYFCDVFDYYVAAVRDLPQVLYDNQPIGKEIAGRDYFNSGVMLLNLKKMRDNDIENVLIETKRNHGDLSLMDQNIFNIVFKDNVLQLPFLFNTCYINLIESKSRFNIDTINKLYSTSYKNVYEILPNIKIMHFSSKLKPWYFYDVPLADEWLRYYKMSSMGNVKLQRIFHTKRNVDMNAVKEKVKRLSEMRHDDFQRVIPIAFAGNEQYLPYAAVAIQSIYENSNPDFFYDVNILVDASMTENMKNRLSSIRYPNVQITLWDVRNSLNGIDLYSVGHYSKQMYYRWLIPEVLSMYDKVVYLDCDLVVEKDIANLYDISIGNNFVGAVNNFLRDNLYSHVCNRLRLDVPQYYNSGVLTMNCRAWINRNLKNLCIKRLAVYGKLPCPDQDVLNIVCKGKIFRLNDRWNFQWHHQFSEVTKGDLMLDYQQRFSSIKRRGAWIIHYTSQIKPWNHPEKSFAEIFWRYCRSTLFYESILFENIKSIVSDKKGGSVKKHSKSTKQTEIERLKKHLEETKKSFTYKLSRLISWLPRKLKGYDYSPVCGAEAGESKQLDSLNRAVYELHNSRSFKLAYKLTALPRKIREKLKGKK